MNQEKKDFNLPKRYIFIILIFGIIFVSVSVIFFKGKDLNNYRLKIDSPEESLSDALLKNNIDVINTMKSSNENKLRLIDKDDHVLGEIDAQIKIVYYNDFDIPFNENIFNIFDKIQEEFKDVVIAYRHFPMRTNTNSFSSALASECATEQNKFWEMAEALVADKTKGILSEENYLLRAEELELDMEKFQNCLDEEKYLDKIQEQSEEAKNFGVNGAPTIFVNNIILPGAYPFEDFIDSSERERKGLKSVIEGELLK